MRVRASARAGEISGRFVPPLKLDCKIVIFSIVLVRVLKIDLEFFKIMF